MSKKCIWLLILVIGMVFAAYSSYSAEKLSEAKSASGGGLVGYWNLDEGKGEIAKDSSGNKLDGEVNASKWVKGKIGNALEFDGDVSYVEVGDKDNLDVGTGNFSIEAWVKFAQYEPDAWDDDVIVKFDLTAPRHGYLLGIRGSADTVGNKNRPLFILGLGTGSGVHLFGTSPINDGVWHYLVVTVDRKGAIKMYRDGVLESQVDISKYSAENEDNDISLSIGGKTSPGSTVDGVIDEVKIYNRTLSEDEIKTNYKNIAEKK